MCELRDLNQHIALNRWRSICDGGQALRNGVERRKRHDPIIARLTNPRRKRPHASVAYASEV